MRSRGLFVSRRALIVIGLLALLSLGGGVAFAAVLRPGAPSGRSAAPTYGVDISAVYDAHGDPVMYANFSPDGGLATARWWVCPPGKSCSPLRPGTGLVQPGATAPGTVFEARARYRGVTYVGRTAAWQGQLHATSAPYLTGGARAGELVEPHAGTWAGGWKPVADYHVFDGGSSGGRAPAFDVLNVEACRTASGQGCVNLSPQGEAVAFSSRAVRLAAGVTGRYLIAFDQRSSPDQAIAGVGYSNPAAIPVVTPGTTVSHSAAHGPITGPAPPRVRILPHAISRPSTVIVARVRCSTRCRVQTFVTSRSGAAGSDQTIQGAHWIAVPRHQLTAGTLSVQIYASDGPGVRGTSHLSSGGYPGQVTVTT